MSCYDYAARINFNEGNLKRQIVKGRVSFSILTLRITIPSTWTLNWGVTPSDSVDKMDRFVTFPSVRPTTSIRCVYRAELILLLLLLLLPILCRAAFYCRIIAHWRSGQEELVRSDTVTVYWQIFAVYRTQLITRSWAWHSMIS